MLGKPSGQVSAIFLVFALALAIFFFAELSILSVQNAVIIILALLIFFVAFVNTQFALCILIFSMLFSPEIGAGGIPGRAVVVRAEDLFLMVIFFGWFAQMAINKELGLVRVNPLNRPLAIYIFICFLTTLLGILRGELTMKSSFFYLFKYIEYFLLFFMVINNLRNEKQAKTFVFLILLTCLLVCLYGLTQIPGGERVTAPFEGKEGGEPNTFAGYLLLMMGLVIGFTLQYRRHRPALLAFLGLCITVFVFTLSRGGWLGFFPMCLVFIAVNKRYRFQLILIMASLVLLLPFIMPQKVRDRIQSTFNKEKSVTVMGSRLEMAESATSRIDTWSNGFQVWRNHPFLGVGIPSGNVIDNQYIRVLTETGAAGILVFLWLLAAIARACLYVHRQMADDPFARAVSSGLLAGMAGILMQSFTSADFILIRVMEPFWFLTAIVVILPGLRQEEMGVNGHTA